MILLFIKSLYILIHLLIGIYDFSFYRIPNSFLGALLVLYGISAPFYIGAETILTSGLVFVIILLLAIGLYALKLIGGGDAKYLAVATLWVGAHGALDFIFFVALIGGILAIIYLFLRNPIGHVSDSVWSWIQKREERWPMLRYVWKGSGTGSEMGKRENVSSAMIPYGMAIATAAILMIKFTPLML